MDRPARIFISVCETSADIHAASLVQAARRAGAHWDFYGLTGPRLRALGVETIYDFASHAAMLSGIVGVLGHAVAALRTIDRAWRQRRPDVVVLLDSPELHLKVARRAKRLGIPVVYYIAPQTWASRAYRNRQIIRDVDRLACILPFEEGYFRRAAHQSPNGRPAPAGNSTAGALANASSSALQPPAQQRTRFRAEYVGHPLFEALGRERPVSGTVDFLRGRAAGRPMLALLPGSRAGVIDAMLPLQLSVVRGLRAKGVNAYAAISCLDERARGRMRALLADGAADGPVPSDGPLDTEFDVVVNDNASLLTAADLALVASGTAVLHVGHYRKPMVVMYQNPGWQYWIYRAIRRHLLTTRHLSLLNVLADARIVPEFMPFIRSVAPIVDLTAALLRDRQWRERMIAQIDATIRPLEESDASTNVCRLITELLSAGTATATSRPAAPQTD